MIDYNKLLLFHVDWLRSFISLIVFWLSKTYKWLGSRGRWRWRWGLDGVDKRHGHTEGRQARGDSQQRAESNQLGVSSWQCVSMADSNILWLSLYPPPTAIWADRYFAWAHHSTHFGCRFHGYSLLDAKRQTLVPVKRS